MALTKRKKKVVKVIPQENNVQEMPVKTTGVLEKLTPVLLIASIFLAFAVGVLWQKVQNLESGGAALGGGQPVAPVAPSNPSGELTEAQVEQVPAVDSSDHVRGNRNAKVFLIEYSDLECPYCKQFHPTAQQVVDEYGDDVAWVYRHFPLDQIHPNARPSAEASECVAELGGNDKFWEFVDLVFTDVTYLSNLQSAAEKVGVNGAAFKTCYDSGKYKDNVEKEYQDGINAGVTGTPANFIINANGKGWLVPGALPFDQIKVTLDQALEN